MMLRLLFVMAFVLLMALGCEKKEAQQEEAAQPPAQEQAAPQADTTAAPDTAAPADTGAMQ